MNSRNREQKYLEIKKKKVYKCFNIPFQQQFIGNLRG